MIRNLNTWCENLSVFWTHDAKFEHMIRKSRRFVNTWYEIWTHNTKISLIFNTWYDNLSEMSNELHMEFVTHWVSCVDLRHTFVCLSTFSFIWSSLHTHEWVIARGFFPSCVKPSTWTTWSVFFVITNVMGCVVLYLQNKTWPARYSLYFFFEGVLYSLLFVKSSTGWRRPLKCLKSQVYFRKRATKYSALWWKMTYTNTNKAS